MGAQRTISGTQFTLMLVASYVTAGLFAFPTEVVREAGAGGLVSVLLVTVVAFLAALLVVWVGAHFPGMTAVEWGDAIVPLFPLHRILASIGALFHVVMPPIIIRMFTEMMKETFFQVTPVWALALPLIAVGAYGAWLGVEAIGRVTVVALPLMLSTLTVAYVLTIPLWSGYRLRPDLTDIPGVLRGAFFGTLLYEGLASAMLLQSKLERPERAVRYVCWSFLISTLLFGLIYTATVGAFGGHGVAMIAWPAPQVLLYVRIRGWFTERLGLFVEIVWAGLLVLQTAIHLWAVGLASVQVFGWKQRRTYPWVVLSEACAYFAVAVLPRDFHQVDRIFNFMVWGFLYLNIGMPMLWLVVGLLRGSFRQKHPQGRRAPPS